LDFSTHAAIVYAPSRLADRLGPDGVFIARLVPEPDNPYDASAVAVCVDGTLAKVGHLARQVAENYHQRLLGHGAPVTCPAKLTGVGRGTVGVVLDFEDVRVALGLPRVSVDQSDMDYAAVAEYHRLNNANRVFVHETRPLEKSDPIEAVARYRRAVTVLKDCRDLGRARGLESYGFTPNQTDAVPIERLTMCLVKMRRIEEASAEFEDFLEAFPSAKNMKLVANVRERICRARQRTAASGPDVPEAY
jgi:hypothetical protein